MSATVVEAPLPIDRVTLLEDRARVSRRGRVTVGDGTTRVRVEGVSPVLVDKTLHAGCAGDTARVIDVVAERRIAIVGGEDDADEVTLAEVRAEGERLDGEISALLDDKLVLERRAAGLDEAAGHLIAEASVDVALGRDVLAALGSHLDRIQGEERELRLRLAQVAESLKELYAEHDRLGVRLASLHEPLRREVAALEVTIEGTAGEVELVVDYTVPGACWRPTYVASLTSKPMADSGKVELRSDACVWQRTGEEWKDVLLSFSTARPSLGTRPPELDSDVLSVQRKSAQVVVETREEELHTTGLGPHVRITAEVPGVDDGGEVVHLRAQRRATIPSDGRAHRITLGRFSSPATTALVAVPELSTSIYLRSVQTNEGRVPILAGPVDLVRNGGLVGRTSVLYVAPGERFELGWGPEAELRVARSYEHPHDKARMLSSWVTRAHLVNVTLSNLGASERIVQVRERVPISEIDRVRVELDEQVSSPDTGVDPEGFVDWTVTLPAFGHESRTLRYLVKRHEDVVVDGAR